MLAHTAVARPAQPIFQRRAGVATTTVGQTPAEPQGHQDIREPQDLVNPQTLLDRVGKETERAQTAWKDSFESTLGRAGGIATSVGALSVGVLGGAAIAAAAQWGVGPTLEFLGQAGAGGFLTEAIQYSGSITNMGLAFGGVAGAAGAIGAWNVGKTLGGGVGRAAGSLLGSPVGVVTGIKKGVESLANGEEPLTAGPEQKPDRRVSKPMNGAQKTLATVVGGVGVVGGAAGGFALGASLLATGGLMDLGTAAVAGGVIGGVAFAALGGMGGIRVGRGAGKLWDKAINRLRGESLGQRMERVENKEQALRGLRIETETRVQGAHQQHRQRTAELDELQQQNENREQQVQSGLETIDQTVESEAQATFHQSSEELHEWDQRLDDLQSRLDKRQAEIEAKQAAFDNFRLGSVAGPSSGPWGFGLITTPKSTNETLQRY
jgi:hypothetical protein